MKALTIMPNFTIMAEVSNKHYMSNLFGILRCFCKVEANVEHMDSYRITPESIWEGMNSVPEVDFIELLKENVNGTFPSNVLTDLEKFKSRFGIVTLIGDDCLKVKDKDVLTEIKNNTKLNEMIYEYEDDLVFFSGDINLVQRILHNDIFCPIKFRSSKMITFILDDKEERYVVKAPNAVNALKALYGKHRNINEELLRTRMSYRKSEITDEVIDEFISVVYEDIKKDLTMMRVPEKSNREPIKV